MRRLAAMLGCTEGQGYTAVLGVLVAVVLTLTGLPGALRDLPAGPAEAALAPRPQVTTTVSSPISDVTTPNRPVALPPRTPSPGAPIPTVRERPEVTGRPSGRTEEPPPSPCAQAAANENTAALVDEIDTLTGGAYPDGSTLEVLSLLTGCSTKDPALTAVGALIEIGDTLPDTGLDGLLPDLPPLDIPPAIAELAPSLEPVLGPVCTTGSTVALLVFVFASHYPAPLDDAFLKTSNGLLAVCAQLYPTSASD